jgi:hypothetical protein
MKRMKHILAIVMFVVITSFTVSTASADLVSNSGRALQQLVAQNPAAARCKSQAAAVLVFPKVVKAGFIVGAQEGQGILFVRGRPSGRYRRKARDHINEVFEFANVTGIGVVLPTVDVNKKEGALRLANRVDRSCSL